MKWSASWITVLQWKEHCYEIIWVPVLQKVVISFQTILIAVILLIVYAYLLR